MNHPAGQSPCTACDTLTGTTTPGSTVALPDLDIAPGVASRPATPAPWYSQPLLPEGGQRLLARIEELDAQMILFERMSAAVSLDHGQAVRDDLTGEETAMFVGRWSQAVLDVCMSAGVTSGEVRSALRTGVLPDKGIVLMLAGLRGDPRTGTE